MTTEEKVKFLETALVECYDAAIPQAMPWTGSLEEKAIYAAKVLPEHIKGLNRLLAYKSDELKILQQGIETLLDKVDIPDKVEMSESILKLNSKNTMTIPVCEGNPMKDPRFHKFTTGEDGLGCLHCDRPEEEHGTI